MGLLFAGREARPASGHAGGTLLLVKEPLGVTVPQPGEPLPQLPDLRFTRGLCLPLGAPRCRQAAAICLGQTLRLGPQRPPCSPPGQRHQLRPTLGLGTDACPSTAVGLGAETALRGIQPGVPRGGLATDRRPVPGLAPGVPRHEPWQQVPCPAARVARVALVLPALGWDRRTQVRLHPRRARNGEPRIGGHIPAGAGTPGLEGAGALRPYPGAPGFVPRLAKRGRPCVSRMVQAPPDHTALPHRLARTRHFPRLGEAPAPLAHAPPLAPHPGTPWADSPGFVRANLLAGLAAPRRRVAVAITIRCPAEPMHHTRAGRMSCPATRAFDHLGPFRRGQHPWDLAQELLCRAAAHLAVYAHPLDAQALAFLPS